MVLGELMIDVTPAFGPISWEDQSKYDAVVADLSGTYGYEFINANELLAEVVKQAKTKNANGITNLQITKTYNNGTPIYSIRATCIYK